MLPKHISKRVSVLLAGDAKAIFLALMTAPWIRFGETAVGLVQSPWGIAATIALYVFCFYMADLYDADVRFGSARSLFKAGLAMAAVLSLSAGLFYLAPSLRAPRGVFIISAVLTAVFFVAWRLFFERVFRGFLRREEKLLIVGAGRAGRTFYEAVRHEPLYNVIGFIDDDPGKWGTSCSPTVLGGSSIMGETVERNHVNGLVLAITRLKGPELLRNMLVCKMNGVKVYDMPGFYETLTGKLPVEHVDDFWFTSTAMAGVNPSVYTKRGKRLLDIMCSLAGLVLGAPLILITAVAVRLESSGPVFYRQKRVGLHGEVFSLIKFRSMKEDAEKDGAVWAVEHDPRVTRVGSVIRRLRIDEMPQMWNVLKGEMSFIGPRPERPEFVEVLGQRIPYYGLRHSVKPGITGWAQVNCAYAASIEDSMDKLCHDFFYIKNLTPLLDFHVLLKTIRVVLLGRGAR